MKFVFASDSFKGTLSSEQTAAFLTEAAKKMFPDVECCSVPVADGGEGTVDAVLRAVHGQKIPVSVHGPYMEKFVSYYGMLQGQKAVIGVSDASGLFLLSREQRNPLFTTSYGTGELIRAALDAGCRDISIAAGGSASNDGGTGCMQALGVKFLDKKGRELRGTGANLRDISRIDLSGLHPAAKKAKFTVLCDVDTPLCGPHGTTYSFGGKKGGSRQMLDELEHGMENYKEVLARTFPAVSERSGKDQKFAELAGSGAGGGLAAAFHIFFGAELKRGIDGVLDLIGFDSLLDHADCIITGEGRADSMSVYGKVMSGVGRRGHARGIPVFAIVGSMGAGAEEIYACGVDSMITTVNEAMPIEDAMKQAEALYKNAADRLMRILRVGYDLCNLKLTEQGAEPLC